MRVPGRFALTRPEQRLVVVVVLALVITAATMHLHHTEPPRLAPAQVSPPPVEDESPNEQE